MNIHNEVGDYSMYKPRGLDKFNGRREFVSVNTRLFKMEQYFTLMNEFNSNTLAIEVSRVTFASTFLSDSPAIRCYSKVSSGTASNTWNEFSECIKQEFVPADYAKRTRDKPRKLRQAGSVSRYLSEFRSVVLTTPG